MAPIISIFLRMAQDPTLGHNQGWRRAQPARHRRSKLLQPTDLPRLESLTCSSGLMAYDWLRVLIWFDHMGLQVATLVNFSFVGMDAVNARLARALSHGPRGQAIPEGLRRFATWAPLLVPFYIPRGGEWEYVWTRAEGMHGHAGPLLPAVRDLVGAYVVAAVLAIALGAWVLTRARRAGTLHRCAVPRQRT
ncbi:MAG: hypothetical protein IPH23_14920 [Gammaproteobacteria bacterium]|nr:hypothetical protein [Gammaproteobacteria bacterium]